MGKKKYLGLKKFRERMDLKQLAMAEKLGVNRATYNSWEIGRRDPPFAIVQQLFEMGATVEELFGVPDKEDVLQNILNRLVKIEGKL
jgi:DNA-binding XRE family transcriptional regulator